MIVCSATGMAHLELRRSPNPVKFNFRQTLGTRLESYCSTQTRSQRFTQHTLNYRGRVLTGYESVVLEGHARLAASASGSVTRWRLLW